METTPTAQLSFRRALAARVGSGMWRLKQGVAPMPATERNKNPAEDDRPGIKGAALALAIAED
jgi:hypothetical protein